MAEKKIIEVEVKTGSGEAKLGKLKEEVKGVGDEAKNTQGNISGMASIADGATGGMISKFNAFKNTLSGVSQGFKGLRVAIMATGLGALVLVIASIVSAFKTSEEGQNKWAKVMAVVGAVVGKFTDALSALGETLINVFTKPIETVKKLGNAITSFFKSPLETIKSLVSSTKEFIKETERAAVAAAKIADQRARADKIERGLIVERAESDRKRAELLERAQQKDKFNQKERIAFLKEASKLEEEITNKEIEAAKIRRDALIKENTLSRSNKDALKAEEEAKAAVIQLETARLMKQKEVTGQIQGLIAEETATAKAAAAERANARKAKLAEELKAKEEQVKKELEIERDRLHNIQNLENEFRANLEQLENEIFDSKLSAQEREENAVRDKYFNIIEQARAHGEDVTMLEQSLEDKLQEIRDKAEKEAEDKRKAANDKELADAKALQAAKVQAVQNGFSTIASLAELFSGQSEEQQKKAFKVQKAANIANALIDTYKSATASYSSLAGIPVVGVPLGIAAAAAATAAGLANVKNIKNQQFAGGGGGGASSSIPRLSTPSGVGGSGTGSPQFNIVGNTGVNQLDALKQPIKAFVVSGDVTTAQSLDRNKIETAKL